MGSGRSPTTRAHPATVATTPHPTIHRIAAKYGTRSGARASTLLIALAGALASPPVLAQDAAARGRAADAFDEGVRLFEQAEYRAAALSFWRAHEALPNDEALTNALNAATRAQDHLLVARVALAALSRGATAAALARQARDALTTVAPKLARLTLDCEPAPCALTLDGIPVDPGDHYGLPGSHVVLATASDGTETTHRFQAAPGTSYRIVVHAPKTGEKTEHARVSESAGSLPGALASAPPAREPAPARAARHPRSDTPPPTPRDEDGWSPTVFYVGLGVTAVLAGVTTWSGLETLGARDDLPPNPSRAQVDDVSAKVARTDVLLAATAVAGAATTWIGLSLVRWGDAGGAAVVVRPDGASLVAAGRWR